MYELLTTIYAGMKKLDFNMKYLERDTNYLRSIVIASKAIEYMIVYFRLANDVFHITDKLENKDYLSLTDEILQRIEFSDIKDGEKGMENLKKAQDLIKRLHRRQLYKPCGYLLLTPEAVAQFNPKSEGGEQHNDVLSTPPKKMRSHNESKEENDREDKESLQCHAKIAYHEIERKWALEMWEMYSREYLGNGDKENDEQRSIRRNDLVIQLLSVSFGMETQHPIERYFL